MLNKILAKPFPNEQPELLLRRHWFVLTMRIVRSIFFLFVPFIVLGLLSIFGIQLDTHLGDPLFAVLVLFILFYSGVVLLSLFTTWLDYSLDIWLVTNDRIVSVEQMGLFNRKLTEHRLDRVQDVTSEVYGFLKTMVDYGNVIIQTAGEQPHVTLKDVPHPTDVARRIIELQNEALARMQDVQGGVTGFPHPKPIAQPPVTQNPTQKK